MEGVGTDGGAGGAAAAWFLKNGFVLPPADGAGGVDAALDEPCIIRLKGLCDEAAAVGGPTAEGAGGGGGGGGGAATAGSTLGTDAGGAGGGGAATGAGGAGGG